MSEIQMREALLDLIREAIEALSRLGDQYHAELAPVFAYAQEALETPASVQQSQILVIAAARQRIALAEKKTIAYLIHDDSVSSLQMPYLVRLRLICYKLITLLNEIIEQRKESQRTPRPRG